MKAKLLAVFCALTMLLGAVPAAGALEGEAQRAADTLVTLGLIDETGDLTAPATRAQAAVLLVTSYQMPINGGIIRGGGDTRFILILDIISVAVFIPLAMLGGLVFHWPTIAVIVCINIDQALKCIPAYIRVNSYKWIKKLTR